MIKEKYLVTGANGFIGSWVVRELIKDGVDIIAVVSPGSDIWRLREVSHNIKVLEADLRRATQTQQLIKKTKPQYILHLATFGVYPYQQKSEKRIIMGNYQMAINLLEAARRTEIKKFVNTGSVFEYGAQEGKVSEDDVDTSDILNKYSASKMATTALVSSYYNEFPIVTLRPFTNFGPLEDESRFIYIAISQCLKKEEVRVAPGVIRDFVYVKDVARAFKKACSSDKAGGEIINIASGRKYTLLEVAKTIKLLTKSRVEIIEDSAFLRERDSRCWADITKAKELLGWAPKYSLEIALKETIDWVKTTLSTAPESQP